MPFRCYRCGRCCTAIGPYITIHAREKDMFHCTSSMTGERFFGRLTGSGKEVFDDTSIFSAFPDACPFLRVGDTENTYICTIYDTMPSHCKNFACYVILIKDSQGLVVGKVRNNRFLSTDDADLQRLFNTDILPIQSKNEAIWQKEAKKILVSAGYKVIM